MGTLPLLCLLLFGSLASSLWSPSAKGADPPHVAIVRSWVQAGERESKGPNRSPLIDRANRAAGVPLGSSYCASSQGLALTIAGALLPKYRGGLATGYITPESIDAGDVLTGRQKIERGDLGIWRKGSTVFGHICVVDTVIDRRTFWSLEGNTSSGGAGSQSNGDGFYRRLRRIQPYSYFRLVKFTRVRYASPTKSGRYAHRSRYSRGRPPLLRRRSPSRSMASVSPGSGDCLGPLTHNRDPLWSLSLPVIFVGSSSPRRSAWRFSSSVFC